MTIIEKEIAKREAIIQEWADNVAKLELMKSEMSALEAEIASVDVKTLQDEVDELKTYLPQPEVEDVQAEPEQISIEANSEIVYFS
jgi:hypothetical protein